LFGPRSTAEVSVAANVTGPSMKAADGVAHASPPTLVARNV